MATLYHNGVPHQSLKASYPGISLAATELGVTRSHLWQVLAGKRDSKPLQLRWAAWLAVHPEFARLQHPLPPRLSATSAPLR